MDIIYNEYSLLFYHKNLTQKFIHSFILYSIFHTQTNIETQVAHKYIQLHEYSSTRLLFYLKRVNWQVAIVSVSGKKSSKTNERRRNAKKILDNIQCLEIDICVWPRSFAPDQWSTSRLSHRDSFHDCPCYER